MHIIPKLICLNNGVIISDEEVLMLPINNMDNAILSQLILKIHVLGLIFFDEDSLIQSTNVCHNDLCLGNPCECPHFSRYK